MPKKRRPKLGLMEKLQATYQLSASYALIEDDAFARLPASGTSKASRAIPAAQTTTAHDTAFLRYLVASLSI